MIPPCVMSYCEPPKWHDSQHDVLLCDLTPIRICALCNSNRTTWPYIHYRHVWWMVHIQQPSYHEQTTVFTSSHHRARRIVHSCVSDTACTHNQAWSHQVTEHVHTWFININVNTHDMIQINTTTNITTMWPLPTITSSLLLIYHSCVTSVHFPGACTMRCHVSIYDSPRLWYDCVLYLFTCYDFEFVGCFYVVSERSHTYSSQLVIPQCMRSPLEVRIWWYTVSLTLSAWRWCDCIDGLWIYMMCPILSCECFCKCFGRILIHTWYVFVCKFQFLTYERLRSWHVHNRTVDAPSV
jgi:hypothetical protein